MRIAVYHNLLPGGALRALRNMVAQSASSHEYHVYRVVNLAKPTESPDGLEDCGAIAHDVVNHRSYVPAQLLLPVDRGIELFGLWQAETEIARQIDGGRYELSFVHQCRLTQSPSVLSKLRTPSLYFAQEPRRVSYEKPMADASKGLHRFPYSWLELGLRYVLKQADQRAMSAATAVACNSLYSAESLYRVYARNATVVHLGVDTELFKRRSQNIENYVLSVGALEPIKGHATVIEALSLIPIDRRPSLRIVFEREMPRYEAVLRGLAQRADVGLTLHRQVSDDELAVLYSKAKATICAARLEPFGLTPLESLSCGTPVVAINEGGFRESISDGVNGVLVPPSPAGIATGITAVLEGHVIRDPQKLRATVQTRTWDRTVHQLNELFAAAAAGQPRTNAYARHPS
jgi:glycosyltransferase involved in cell wall biosynthesis